METEIPAAPARAHTEVLEQFFAGHLTAGQLTERLQTGVRYAPPAADSASTASLPAVAGPTRRRPNRRVLSLGALMAIVAAGGVATGIGIASNAQPVAAHGSPSADRPVSAHRHSTRATKRHVASTRATVAAATPARSWTPAVAAASPARPSAPPARPKAHKPAQPSAHGPASKPTHSAPAPTTTGTGSTSAPTSTTPTQTTTGTASTPPPTGTTTGPTTTTGGG